MDQKDINYIIEAHRDHPRKESKAFRKWDGKTPYYIHPIWCSTMIACETTLENKIRHNGALVLLYHDILEDTTKTLPSWLSAEICHQINEMTFHGGSSQEMKEIWTRSKIIRLYKLYDKVSNLLDGNWMDPKKRNTYEKYTIKLCEDVESNYGILNITRISSGIL